jgi:exodeoxyribonuclease-3
MKIISWNVNGIRAVDRKGNLAEILENEKPDILLIQEIKAKEEQLDKLKFREKYADYTQFYHSAEKPGYAGTAIWLRKDFFAGISPEFHTGMNDFDDDEGRISRISFTKNRTDFEILGVYFPNGGKSPEAWDGKLIFYEKFLNFANFLREQGKTVIFAGDVNCAHHEIDLARPESNKNSIGFLPEERVWITKWIENGWVDIFREKFPDKVVYSWWHVITRARSRNVGWRIDYFFVDEKFRGNCKSIEYLNDQMGSDHCPVLLEIS